LDALVEAFKDDGVWLAPVVGVFAQRLRKVAGHDLKQLQITKETFDSLFRYSTSFGKRGKGDGTGSERSDLPLLLVTELMKVYVLIGSESMTRNLIGTVQHPTFPPLESFSTPRRIVYSYYAGRSAVLENEPAQAVVMLEFAWNAVGPNRSRRNRARILEYLIPARLALGFRPSKSKLREIAQYSPLLASCVARIGNGQVKQFVDLLAANQAHFCRFGTYSMLSRCRMLAARNLLRICVQMHREEVAQAEKNKFPLSKFYPAVAKWDDFDELDDLVDHTKCLVVNLIASGLVKGYLAFEREILVVSATDAFPKTSQVLQ